MVLASLSSTLGSWQPTDEELERGRDLIFKDAVDGGCPESNDEGILRGGAD